MFKEIVVHSGRGRGVLRVDVPSATNVDFGSNAWSCLNALRIRGSRSGLEC